jgi:hypothetical protein
MSKRKGPRGIVRLISYAADGSVLDRTEVSYEVYYSGQTPVVDSDTFRSEHRVRRLTGEIYGSKGNLQQTFENTYDENGKYLRSRIAYEDGTVVQD